MPTINSSVTLEVGKCRECGKAENVQLATADKGDCRVEWCEDGHVVVVDPNLRMGVRLVYDFKDGDRL